MRYPCACYLASGLLYHALSRFALCSLLSSFASPWMEEIRGLLYIKELNVLSKEMMCWTCCRRPQRWSQSFDCCSLCKTVQHTLIDLEEGYAGILGWFLKPRSDWRTGTATSLTKTAFAFFCETVVFLLHTVAPCKDYHAM